MSDDFMHFQTAKYRQAELIRAAEQYHLAQEFIRSEEAGARRTPRWRTRLFGREPQPQACVC